MSNDISNAKLSIDELNIELDCAKRELQQSYQLINGE